MRMFHFMSAIPCGVVQKHQVSASNLIICCGLINKLNPFNIGIMRNQLLSFYVTRIVSGGTEFTFKIKRSAMMIHIVAAVAGTLESTLLSLPRAFDALASAVWFSSL